MSERSKRDISSVSSARTREEVLRRNPRAYDGPTNHEVTIRRLRRELAATADHTTKACIEAAIEKEERRGQLYSEREYLRGLEREVPDFYDSPEIGE